MEFVCYYQEFELPIDGGNYREIADRAVFSYQYNLDGDFYYAVRVNDSCYAVFTCVEDEINETNLLRKAHEVVRLYRETIGIQSRHISADTIRQIETLCGIHNANVNYDNNSETIATANIHLEKKHFVKDNNDYWGITYNNRPLLLLTSENAINRILDIVNEDIFAYIIQRWGRLYNNKNEQSLI